MLIYFLLVNIKLCGNNHNRFFFFQRELYFQTYTEGAFMIMNDLSDGVINGEINGVLQG